MAGITFPLRVIEIKQPNIGVRSFSFQSLDGSTFTYQPGQFFRVHVPATDTTKAVIRSYSLANPPGTDHLDISVDFVEGGVGCAYLYALAEGDVIEASGFFGKLVLPERLLEVYRVFFLATSTGVAPFCAMLNAIERLLTIHPNVTCYLYEGVKTEDRGLYVEEFVHFMRKNPRFQFRLCVSRETPDAGHEYLKPGYVQKQLTEFALNSTDLLYLCGNPKMIDQTFSYCLEQGLRSAQVKREKYFA
ncbi:MAG: FAD-binding oxidoreductase [Pseudomonadota bacterium]